MKRVFPDLSTLTERRKPDREFMCNHLAQLTRSLGMDVTTGAVCYSTKVLECVILHSASSLRLRVDFDGKSCQPDVYVLSWHFDKPGAPRLSDNFKGGINRFHRHKATQVAYGFPDLLECVRINLELARSGAAFSVS